MRNMAYYTSENILNFFNLHGRSWILLHESGHHFDLYTIDYFMNVQEIWVNLYASLYQSKHFFSDPIKYWMQEDDAKKAVETYKKGETLKTLSHRIRAHVLNALFALDSDFFRAYNIKTMNDENISKNIMQSIVLAAKDITGHNAVQFVENLMSLTQKVIWLNVTTQFDMLSASKYVMPCFYFKNRKPNFSNLYIEYDRLYQSNLHLCHTVAQDTISWILKIDKTFDYIFVDGELTKTPNGKAVFTNKKNMISVNGGNRHRNKYILPQYIFCTTQDCAAKINFLNIKETPMSVLMYDEIDIFGLGDKLIAKILLDYTKSIMYIDSFTKDGHVYFPHSKGPYVHLEVYNAKDKKVYEFDIYGTDQSVSLKQINFTENYRIVISPKERKRVIISGVPMMKLQTDSLKLQRNGIIAQNSSDKQIIRKRRYEALQRDFAYKPHLRNYEFLNLMSETLKNSNT